MKWDAALYLVAHAQVLKSQDRCAQGRRLLAGGHLCVARCAYLANFTLNVLLFPLAICCVTLGFIIALAHWDFHIAIYRHAFLWIRSKTNQTLLSAMGIPLPTLAYRFRRVNLLPYVIALRIAAIAWGFAYTLGSFNR